VPGDFLRLLRYASPYKARLSGAALAALASTLFELARPWPTKAIVDYGLAGLPMPAWLATISASLDATTPVRIILWSVAVGAALIVAASLASLLTQVVVFNVAQDMVLELMREVFAKLQRLSLSFHQRHEVGDLTQRAGADVFAAQAVISSVVVPGSAAALTLAGMFYLMFQLDPVLAAITAGALPLLLGAWLVFYRPMNDAARNQWHQQGAILSFIQQSLSGIKVIQGYAREPHVQHRLEDHGRLLGVAHRRSLKVGTTYNQVAAIITGVLGAALVGIGATRVLGGSLTLGDLLVFIGYVAAVNGPLTGVAAAVGTAVAITPKGKRVLDILDSREEVPEEPHPTVPASVQGTIEFEHVSFAYPAESQAERLVFRDVSFRAEAGTVTAIIGITGAGKSSLVGLLSRFYDPMAGTVRLDGCDLRDLPLTWIRENVSVVLQDSILFPATIAENIAFGKPGASRNEIVAAARIARAHDFIERLPAGYETQVVENGTSLSGGERQRIALARAVIKDAPIIILDEPTSSLDAHTEAEIFEGLSEYMRGKTVFIVSHRLTTIRRADQILALENGRIVESGTHESLLRGRGVYARLYRNQNIASL
jgi:ABC-type multidrug transport system fused ATPase/permease subunit